MKFYRYNTEDAFKWVDLLWIRFFLSIENWVFVYEILPRLFSVWWFLDSERILRLLLLPFFSSSTTHTHLTTADILFFHPAKATSAPHQQTFELSDLNSLAKQKLRVVLFKWRFIFLHFFLLLFFLSFHHLILHLICVTVLFFAPTSFHIFHQWTFFFQRADHWKLFKKNKKEEKLEKSNDLSSSFHWKTDFLRFLSLLQTYFNPLSTCLPSLSFSSIPMSKE